MNVDFFLQLKRGAHGRKSTNGTTENYEEFFSRDLHNSFVVL
jgi:hypothetical protein